MIADDILYNSGFVREVADNLCENISCGLIQKSDAILKIFSEQTPKTDLFNLSLYLFDFKPLNIKFDYKIFFACRDLFCCDNIEYINQNEKEYFLLSYQYLPVENNPVHFELYVINKDNGMKIPRSNKNHDRNLAKAILKNYLVNFIMTDTVCFTAWEQDDALLDCYKVEWENRDGNVYICDK